MPDIMVQCPGKMQEVIVHDQRIPACPSLPLGSHRAPSSIGSRFLRVPAPDAKDLEPYSPETETTNGHFQNYQK